MRRTDVYYGLWNPSIGTLVLYTLALTHVTIVSATVYLYRGSAHRALELHPALQHSSPAPSTISAMRSPTR